MFWGKQNKLRMFQDRLYIKDELVGEVHYSSKSAYILTLNRVLTVNDTFLVLELVKAYYYKVAGHDISDDGIIIAYDRPTAAQSFYDKVLHRIVMLNNTVSSEGTRELYSYISNNPTYEGAKYVNSQLAESEQIKED